MTDYQIFLLGDDAVAVQPADRRLRHALAKSLRKAGDWVAVVPGKEFVAAQFDPAGLSPGDAVRRLVSWLGDFRPGTQWAGAPVDLRLDISGANAPDLEELAMQNGLTPEAFLEKVIQSELVVDMMGFTPGFAYVDGVDPALHAERLAVPRQRVSAGSVGLLRGQLGLYALSGPGGWPIIGRLTDTLFDPARDRPFLLAEGTQLRLTLAGR